MKYVIGILVYVGALAIGTYVFGFEPPPPLSLAGIGFFITLVGFGTAMKIVERAD